VADAVADAADAVAAAAARQLRDAVQRVALLLRAVPQVAVEQRVAVGQIHLLRHRSLLVVEQPASIALTMVARRGA
jgi:hypothetical protein